MRYMTISFCALVIIIFIGLPQASVIRHVPSEYSTIQDAINASEDRDIVLVADGVYTGEGNRGINFLGKAITVTSVNGPENCTIDCQQAPAFGFGFVSGENGSAVLRGFRIVNCRCSGIYCERSSPTIMDCIISENQFPEGGGIHCFLASPTVVNCIISNNSINSPDPTWGHGGGIFMLASSPTIVNCVISENTAIHSYGGEGGGMFMFESSPKIYNCAIYGNSSAYGAALCVSGYDFDNLSKPTLVNCTISDNQAIAADEWASGIFTGQFTVLTIKNSVLWGNAPVELIEWEPNSVFVTYSDVQGGWPGTGNIDMDPLFIDPENSDYHLQSVDNGYPEDSPCIDSGKPSGSDACQPPGLGSDRSDMGAYGGAHNCPYEEEEQPQEANVVLHTPTPSIGINGFLLTEEYMHVISVGDHIKVPITFRNEGDETSTGWHVTFVGHPSTGRHAGVQVKTFGGSWEYLTDPIAISIPGNMKATVEIWLYIEPCGLENYAGQLLPNNPQLQVILSPPEGSPSVDNIPIVLEKIEWDIPCSDYGYTFDMTDPSCLHTVDFSIQRYGQYAVGAWWSTLPVQDPENDSYKLDPDYSYICMKNLKETIHGEFGYDPRQGLFPRRPDNETLRKRGADAGVCTHLSDFTTGVARSLGIPSRIIYMKGHQLSEVWIGQDPENVSDAEDDFSWKNIDIAQDYYDEGYDHYGDYVGLLGFAYAEEYPLTSASHIWLSTCCSRFCYLTTVCPVCRITYETGCYATRLACIDLECQDCVTSRYRPPLLEKLPSLDVDSAIVISLDAPASVEINVSFPCKLYLENAGDDTLKQVSVEFSKRLYGLDTLATFEVVDSIKVISELNPGQIDSVQWEIVPRRAGKELFLTVTLWDSAFSNVGGLTQFINVNESGTLPDLLIKEYTEEKTSYPGGSIELNVFILDNIFQNVSDANAHYQIVSLQDTNYSLDGMLSYSPVDSTYSHVVPIPNDAKLGNYGVTYIAEKIEYESDTLESILTFYSNDLQLATSGPDTVVSSDTFTISGILSDRDSTIFHARVESKMITVYGILSIPHTADSLGNFDAVIVPGDLIFLFDDLGVPPGTWHIVTKAEYYGSHVQDSIELFVKAPDLQITASDLWFSPSDSCLSDPEVLILAQIGNVGSCASETSTVRFMVDAPDSTGTVISTKKLPPIEPDSSKLVVAFWGGADGDHEVFVIVDNYDEVVESDETNNVASAILDFCLTRGDANNDGAIDVADAMYLINYLFIGGSAPDPLWLGDANSDEAVDIADVMYLINYLFIGGSPPSKA